MSAFPYDLPYRTRLPPDLKILANRVWSPSGFRRGGGGPLSTLLRALGRKNLTARQLAIAEKFVRVACKDERRDCTALLVRNGTSVRLEVFSSGLFFWETWRVRAVPLALAYRCGSYRVKGGRTMWVEFG